MMLPIVKFMIFSHNYNFILKINLWVKNQDKNHHHVCNQETLKLQLTETNALLDEHEKVLMPIVYITGVVDGVQKCTQGEKKCKSANSTRKLHFQDYSFVLYKNFSSVIRLHTIPWY
jgi:hypothetical protein